MDPDGYYLAFALAYVRGRFPELASQSDESALEEGRVRGLRLHRFKRTGGLARVRKVIGALKGFAPTTLLDIGTGRGVFLWPLLDEMPELRVTAIDRLAHRVADLEAVSRGGVERLSAIELNAEDLQSIGEPFDVVTILEVLEHVADPVQLAAETLRLARAAVIATVPAKEDNNPEHIRLFTRDSLAELFSAAGAASVRIEHVLGHLVAIAKP